MFTCLFVRVTAHFNVTGAFIFEDLTPFMVTFYLFEEAGEKRLHKMLHRGDGDGDDDDDDDDNDGD